MVSFRKVVKAHNNHMHSDSKKRRSFLALLFAAGDVRRWRRTMTIDKRQPLLSEISRRRKFALLNEHLAPKSCILEVGTGDAWFAGRLRECGHDVVTLDLDSPADVVGDILDWRNLGLEEKSFDAVVALEVIEHVDCLGDICALCKQDGVIMLSSPHPRWDWVMKLLELIHLTQRRTSGHCNLTDFGTINLVHIVFKRPLFIHQVALFRNARQPTDAGDGL